MFMLGFQTERAATIDKPVEEVYATVADFNTWAKWSPWVCQEPDCPIVIDGAPGEVGHYQEWSGERIGAGNMRIDQAMQNEQLGYTITFIKPWKSTAKVVFTFRKKGSGTQVLWRMNGSLPFFLFFMRKKMSAWVGSDYERGLSMLKDLLETGKVLSASNYQEVAVQDPFYYAGIRTQCRIDEIGQTMQADFDRLGNDLEKGKLPQPDFVVSLYHKFDFVSRDVDYIAGFIYKEDHGLDATSGYEIGSVAAHRAIKVIHTGAYKHLGNAWSTAMGARMVLKKRIDKAVPMYEIYHSDPHRVAEKDLITGIYVPVR